MSHYQEVIVRLAVRRRTATITAPDAAAIRRTSSGELERGGLAGLPGPYRAIYAAGSTTTYNTEGRAKALAGLRGFQSIADVILDPEALFASALGWRSQWRWISHVVHGWLSWRRRMGTWHEVMDVMALCGQVARFDAVGRRTPFGYRDLVRFKEPTPQHYAWLRHRSGSGRS